MQRKQKWYFNENLVRKYFESKWFKFLDSNFTIRWGEIDLIFEKNGVIHFIEVKSSDIIDDFQDYITKSKIKALQKTAQTWIFRKKLDLEYQFDLVIVKNGEIEVMENFLF